MYQEEQAYYAQARIEIDGQISTDKLHRQEPNKVRHFKRLEKYRLPNVHELIFRRSIS